jgi:hypothetical protein
MVVLPLKMTKFTRMSIRDMMESFIQAKAQNLEKNPKKNPKKTLPFHNQSSLKNQN